MEGAEEGNQGNGSGEGMSEPEKGNRGEAGNSSAADRGKQQQEGRRYMGDTREKTSWGGGRTVGGRSYRVEDGDR